MTPQFQHDCDQCVFYGNLRLDELYDLYLCPKKGAMGGSIVARYGNDGWEYRSFPVDTAFHVAERSGTWAAIIQAMESNGAKFDSHFPDEKSTFIDNLDDLFG